MTWIVLGEEKGKISLVSKSNITGILPKGTYLTVEEDEMKFILRVDDSQQIEPYKPSPMIVDMDLTPLLQDQKCKNKISTYRIKDLNPRSDGLIHFIKPQSTARRSNQEEINQAMGNIRKGPLVFIATVHAGQNQLLSDENGKYITTKLPMDMFFHQTLICGKTGSGKTVATKYLAQYFVEKLEGAVLAINVKDVDFLKMNKESISKDKSILKEWEVINEKSHGIDNFVIYYPANTNLDQNQEITPEICKRITLNVSEIEPESLSGLLQGISDVGAQSLPDIFRYWKERESRRVRHDNPRFGDFVQYFSNARDTREFTTLNHRGEEYVVPIHPSTYNNILRNLNHALNFFDNEDAESLTEEDILVRGKMSVINVAEDIQFGSIVLRDLLHRIVDAKSSGRSRVPILIIIDEVHQFYDTDSSEAALSDLARICRTGRNKEIGIIFSSQNPADIPRGLLTVINSKIFFKSDVTVAKLYGILISPEEMESLRKGYAVASIHDLSQLKILKFPLSFAGVFEKEEEE